MYSLTIPDLDYYCLQHPDEYLAVTISHLLFTEINSAQECYFEDKK